MMALRKSLNLFQCLPTWSRLSRVVTPSSLYLAARPIQNGPQQRQLNDCFNPCNSRLIVDVPQRSFHFLRQLTPEVTTQLLANPEPVATVDSKRTLIKFSMLKGKRKTVKAVVSRFYRLHWGGWIRPKAGRHKKLWLKSPERKALTREHVFVSCDKSYLFDKMVTKFWYKRKYYVDNPYENYELRPNFRITKRRG